MEDDASPAASRLRSRGWRDGRLLAGVLLVLVSIVLGARVVAAAEDARLVWAAAHSLAPGTPLQATDVVPVKVRLLGASGRYLSAEAALPAGYVVQRPVDAGELLPVSAVGPARQDERVVTVPVKAMHAPPGLARGQRVDVYVTTKTAGAATPTPPRLLLAAAVVLEVVSPGSRLGAAADRGVVLSVPPATVPTLVEAIQRGEIDLVRVPTGTP